MKDGEIKRLMQKIGDLVMDIDILKEAQRGPTKTALLRSYSLIAVKLI
jgi:hypothetical protein